jgi:hypothetical protein
VDRAESWQRGADAGRYFDELRPAARSKVDSVATALNAAAGVVGSIAAVADAVGSLLQWWELRQARLNRETREETDTRLRFLGDLLDRWVLAHSPGDHIDLDLSHHLAREALGLLRYAGSNGKVLIPQFILYEVERVRQIIAETREVIARQFLALDAAGVETIASPVEGAAPLRINYSALGVLFESPQDAWDRAVAAKDIKSFEKEIHHLSRHPREIISKVFEIDTSEVDGVAAALSPVAQLLSSTERGGMALNLARAVLTASPGGVLLANVVVPLISGYFEEKEIERKDAVRELVLFASEVERARVLVRAWNIVNQTVRAAQGHGLLVLEEADGQPIIATLGRNDSLTRVDAAWLFERRVPALVRVTGGTSLLLGAGASQAGRSDHVG